MRDREIEKLGTIGNDYYANSSFSKLQIKGKELNVLFAL